MSSSPGGSGPGGVGALVRPTALRASARNTLALHSAACRDVPPLARLLAQRCGAPASPLANGLSEHAVRAVQARGSRLCVRMRGSEAVIADCALSRAQPSTVRGQNMQRKGHAVSLHVESTVYCFRTAPQLPL